MKPYAAAAEQNRDVILAAIAPFLKDKTHLLELGSGTGQHAVYFSEAMPWLNWQCSDQAHYLSGIEMWLHEANLSNTPPPIELEVIEGPWPSATYNAVYSCNTTHIMHWQAVEAMFRGVGHCLQDRGIFMLYGPFNYGGSHSSESNRAFDAFLQQQDPGSGIRDKLDLDTLAAQAAMVPLDDIAMPANNRILVWQRPD